MVPVIRLRRFISILPILVILSTSHAAAAGNDSTTSSSSSSSMAVLPPADATKAIFTEGGPVVNVTGTEPASDHGSHRRRVLPDPAPPPAPLVPAPVVEETPTLNSSTVTTINSPDSANVTTNKSIPSIDRPLPVINVTSTGSPPPAATASNNVTIPVTESVAPQSKVGGTKEELPTNGKQNKTEEATAMKNHTLSSSPSPPVPVNVTSVPVVSTASPSTTTSDKSNSSSSIATSPENKSSNITTATPTTTKSTSTSSTTTTTTTTSTTPKPKKPKITVSLNDDPGIIHVPSMKVVDPSHTPVFRNNLDVEEPVAQLSRENLYSERARHSRRELVIPVVSLIFTVPMLLGLATVVFRRFRDYWQTRHYRRMDFLVDGLYND